jgi:hypothetical protein
VRRLARLRSGRDTQARCLPPLAPPSVHGGAGDAEEFSRLADVAARGLKGSLDVGVRYRDLRRDVLGHIEVRPQERELVLEELDRLSERRDLGLKSCVWFTGA